MAIRPWLPDGLGLFWTVTTGVPTALMSAVDGSPPAPFISVIPTALGAVGVKNTPSPRKAA